MRNRRGQSGVPRRCNNTVGSFSPGDLRKDAEERHARKGRGTGRRFLPDKSGYRSDCDVATFQANVYITGARISVSVRIRGRGAACRGAFQVVSSRRARLLFRDKPRATFFSRYRGDIAEDHGDRGVQLSSSLPISLIPS